MNDPARIAAWFDNYRSIHTNAITTLEPRWTKLVFERLRATAP